MSGSESGTFRLGIPGRAFPKAERLKRIIVDKSRQKCIEKFNNAEVA
jgi:hypothetical protein